ncbi:MAG: trypsin-like peptidase domain-containing protein [Microcoleaceae cyanobacterium]
MLNLTASINPLTPLLTSTAALTMVVMLPTSAIATKTPQQVAEIAAPITVQVNSALGDGSGVIIAKNGNIYSVLTVNHVVEDPEESYRIQTQAGETYPVTNVVELQADETEPDLAVIQFESTQEYPVATLGNSDQAVIGAQIYVYGYPATGGLTGAQREPELSPGLVTSRPKSRPEGYTLRYQAVTWSGMSGGPVFDGEGRLVGLHGQGEFGFAQTSAGDITPIKTGFNAAVPINLFVIQLAETALTPDDIMIDESPGITSSMSLENPENAQAYYFRGLTLLDQEKSWEAIADFNQALELEPNNPEAYFNRGLARTQLAANLPEQTRGPNPIADYTEAIRLNPGYADAYYNRGLAYLTLKQYDRAMADFQQAAELYRRLGREESHQDALDRIEELNSQL